MRRFLLVLVCALTLVAASCEPFGNNQPGGPSGSWRLVFSDEFDGTALNTSNWSYGWLGGSNPVQNQEIACYQASAVSVSGGSLHLKSTKTPSTCSKGTNPHPYTSGAVGTGYGSNKHTFSLGYFEARIYLEGNGSQLYSWPAFWLDGTGQWPTTGELDIVEGLSGRAAAHWHDSSGGYNFGTFGYTPGWHVYAALWEVGKVSSYLDGKFVGSHSGSGVGTAVQFISLMNQVSNEGSYGGPPAPTDLRVDWIHVWQR